MTKAEPIPITIFTGFLGAGKTTIILSLLPQLPSGYRAVLLKNEFGDVEVDSQLAKQSSLAAVSEILNGCLCCVLVGQMKTALLEIREKHRPDRIVIETSGSAFPATLAFQIRDLEREFPGYFKLDAILTVIDAENFTGYEDTSVTARMQAQYTDILLVNKWEKVSERHLDTVMDHLFTLNEDTPKLKCSGRNGVPPSLIFGIDSQLFLADNGMSNGAETDHHDEIETATILRGAMRRDTHRADHSHDHDHTHSNETYTATSEPTIAATAIPLTRESLESALAILPKDSIYRVKGFVAFGDGERWILNWAFGRDDLQRLENEYSQEGGVDALEAGLKLTMMGTRGEVKKWAKKLAQNLGAIAE